MKDIEKLSALNQSIPAIEKALGYTFRNKELVIQAFTHSSFLNECRLPLVSNERLEYLGDSVLNLFTASFLFDEFPSLEEGMLSEHKALLVSRHACTLMMEQLNVAQFLVMAHNDSSLRTSPSISANLFEAIVGALFIDGGWDEVKSFLSSHFSTFFHAMLESRSPNPKAALQEYLAKHHLSPPEYRIDAIIGPPHDRTFTITLVSQDEEIASATGRSKREAEKEAAKQALTILQGRSP